MTFVWFAFWLIANNVGGHEPLLFRPVNAWAGALIIAIALDFNGIGIPKRWRLNRRRYAKR